MAKNRMGTGQPGEVPGYKISKMAAASSNPAAAGSPAPDMTTLRMDAAGEVAAENLGNATIDNRYNSSAT
jgi:hypothetical protein